MQLMQYTITLPADYDMDIIRRRVTAKGELTDHFPGLAFKTYLVRERGQHSSTLNQYAPFYLWQTDEGLARFVWGGGGFQGIIDSFGRPPIQHWTLVSPPGTAFHTMTPQWATRTTRLLPLEADLTAELERVQQKEPDTGQRLAQLSGVNIEKWELCTFTLWAERPESYAGDLYQVLHFSAPEQTEKG